MRPILFLLGLIVTLSGPLLRQAEAAGDLGRALAARLDAAGTLAEPDGRVGDDPEEMTPKAGFSPDRTHAEIPSTDLWATSDGHAVFLRATSSLDPASSMRRRDPAPWLPPGAGPRHAWLQLYLF
jgi:hypothetical protein